MNSILYCVLNLVLYNELVDRTTNDLVFVDINVIEELDCDFTLL